MLSLLVLFYPAMGICESRTQWGPLDSLSILLLSRNMQCFIMRVVEMKLMEWMDSNTRLWRYLCISLFKPRNQAVWISLEQVIENSQNGLFRLGQKSFIIKRKFIQLRGWFWFSNSGFPAISTYYIQKRILGQFVIHFYTEYWYIYICIYTLHIEGYFY